MLQFNKVSMGFATVVMHAIVYHTVQGPVTSENTNLSKPPKQHSTFQVPNARSRLLYGRPENDYFYFVMKNTKVFNLQVAN